MNQSEFRRDMVSGEWILISSLRKTKPSSFKGCPFEDPQKSGNPKPILWYPKPGANKFKDWFVQIIPNKYPFLLSKKFCAKFDLEGIHQRIEAFGFHEVVITRDHNKPLSKMSLDEISLVLKAYRERYKMLEKNKCVEYILIFHNHGKMAGASLEHPHSQIAALPIIPPDVSRSIDGGVNFFKKYKKCVHCATLERETKERKRIVYKNKHFITINPYASNVAFETRIFPLKHNSDFEAISDQEISSLASSLKDALARLSKILKNPDYNFFIHTSSARMNNVPYYHWHIEILPRTYKWAGMELGTGIEVVSVAPEEAAELLRKAK